MRALLDLNVLIAMFDEQHVHHRRALDWWADNQTSGWSSCPITQNGFIRVMSQPRYPNPISVREALIVLSKVTSRDDHVLWSDDISLLDAKRFNHDRILGPKQLTDIYLLGLAVKNDGRLATFDRTIPLMAVPGAVSANVAVI